MPLVRVGVVFREPRVFDPYLVRELRLPCDRGVDVGRGAVTRAFEVVGDAEGGHGAFSLAAVRGGEGAGAKACVFGDGTGNVAFTAGPLPGPFPWRERE